MQSEKVLNARQEDGSTLRQHYEMAQRAGRKCPELEQPEINIQVRYLWRWFCEVAQADLRWTELQAWATMTNKQINEWEISTIRIMNREYFK